MFIFLFCPNKVLNPFLANKIEVGTDSMPRASAIHQDILKSRILNFVGRVVESVKLLMFL